MFTSLHELAKKATLMITVTAEGDDQLRVNVTPMPFDTKAKAALPQPLSLVATPAEFDADFIAALGTWQAPKRSLVQQVQDAAAPGAAGESPQLPAPAKQEKEKGKPGRKPKNDKPAEEPPQASGVDAAGAAAGDAAAAADQVMAGDVGAAGSEQADSDAMATSAAGAASDSAGDAATESNAAAGDAGATDVGTQGAPVAIGAEATEPQPTTEEGAAPTLVDADGFEKVDTHTLDLF